MSETRPITDDDLQAYVDARLDSARQDAVERYLEAHPDTARRVQGYIDQREELRAALAPIADEPVPAELNLRRLIEARRRARYDWRHAVAAVLLLCLGGGGGWFMNDAIEHRAAGAGMTALAQEAATNYAVYASDQTRPVEMRDSAELVAWARQRLNYPISVPDLSKAGYRFMGGRLVATEHGPAFLFMYDNNHGTRLVMLTRRMDVDHDMPMVPAPQGDVEGFAWANRGIGYSLVGPLPAATLHPLADDIRRQVQGT